MKRKKKTTSRGILIVIILSVKNDIPKTSL
jgi:hypothetical protein